MHIDFNKYRKVTKDEPHTHSIDLYALADGTRLPTLYLQRIKPKAEAFKVNAKNTDEAVWRANIPIDPKMTDQEYKTVISWWFIEARSNEEYAKHISEKYKALKPTFLQSFTAEAKQWLFDHAHMPKGRRKNIGQFLTNYLNNKLAVDKYLKPGYRSWESGSK